MTPDDGAGGRAVASARSGRTNLEILDMLAPRALFLVVPALALGLVLGATLPVARAQLGGGGSTMLNPGVPFNPSCTIAQPVIYYGAVNAPEAALCNGYGTSAGVNSITHFPAGSGLSPTAVNVPLCQSPNGGGAGVGAPCYALSL